MAATADDLQIAIEKVCFIIDKAHEFDVKEAVADPDSGSNPSDDGMVSVLEDHGDDPVAFELTSFINGLDEDEQIDLVTLVWLGRGDDTLDDWDELRGEAARQHNSRTAAYLLGIPLLPDFLEEGLAKFDLTCEGVGE
ncbi:MAG: DUF3775 domain-containing protein [Xanthobacteraceae bacterium]